MGREFSMKLYTIKNIFSGARLRNNDGDICIFQSYTAAYVYIQEHLSEKYWEVAELWR